MFSHLNTVNEVRNILLWEDNFNANDMYDFQEQRQKVEMRSNTTEVGGKLNKQLLIYL